MNIFDKINEMIEMQKVLDESVYKEHNCEFNESKCRLALYDELGELTHELKGNWCWWKKTQAPVDNTKVLEELVDVWHFAMSIYYHSTETKISNVKFNSAEFGPNMIVKVMKAKGTAIIQAVFELTYSLGFEMDSVYEAYKLKNKVNFERLSSGY